MEIPVFTVDSFTNLPFKGNPAAVCLLQNALQDDLYQHIAAEMNLSETAFVIQLNPADDFTTGARFGLRWFTPTNEVPLCGHATLASAAVLFSVKKNMNSAVAFETLSGDLCVRQRGEGIVMNLPLNKPSNQDQDEVKPLLEAAVGDLPIQDLCYCKNSKKLLVCLADTCDRSVLTSLQLDGETLMRSEKSGKVRGLIITIKGAPESQPGYDFFSRYFAPWNGIPEDPVTGWAHTVLAAYWSEKLGKKKMLAYQASRRGGELELEVKEDDRVDMTGQAVIVLQGTLKL
ncbi:phenazine biosynthesis-like domain-containing protein 1 [Chanos chanos]|uniref:Phenazine biosynthesis-like domain-containing protein 1 n=1 Tax=Chanos chanos TaxID=29144 RepID=A0A6J2V380_CHACN|nr:phenazine biosynthesis-like domain-containing protein [Chanos chanos]